MTARDVISQALALSEAASKAPWHHEPYGGQNQNGDHSGGHVFDADGEYVVPEVCDVDGALIAAARTLLPALAKALGDVLDLADAADFSASMDYDQDCGLVHAHHLREDITAALSEVTP
ncbi:hypothetical protein [Cellulomonas sp. KH9]|uniref:hypothetical protein n=1 Tax=Cellulomonas sp. KH9 TaxID=1855324 RepID=UPI0008EFACAD|nr:hypothetical protein [Cellulomonas sp. KH9]SFK32280.1 hypothetical protein SAMN05216467_2884 [Cellulomonas sp. KH9]